MLVASMIVAALLLLALDLQRLVDALPVIVAAITTLQSGLVKAAAWAWPRFAALSGPVKIALVFLIGLPLYRLLGYAWGEAVIYAACGGAAAAMIYFFGVKRTESEKIAAQEKRFGKATAPAHEREEPASPDHVRKGRHDG